MIARLQYSAPIPGEQLAAHMGNFQQRFKPALVAQPGLVAAFWLSDESGQRVSLTVWASQEDMESGGRNANATPMLPGQREEELVVPSRVEYFEVWDQHIAAAGS